MKKISIARVERVLRAYGNRRRLAILCILKKRKSASVGELAAEMHLSMQALSQHVRLLESLELLERERKGKFVYYRIAPAAPIVPQLMELIQ